MNRKVWLLVAAAAALTAVVGPGRAHAKDTFYYLGYDVVQVFDGERDEVVANIPVKGVLRDSSLTADQKILYITADRHRIHRLDLAARKVTKTVDVSSDGWDRLIYGFTVAPDGGKTGYAHLLLRSVKDGEAVIKPPIVAQIDLDTGKILRSVEVPWGAGQLVGIKDNKTLYALGQDIVRIDVSGPEMKVAEVKPLIDQGKNCLPFWPKDGDNRGIAVAPYYSEKGMGLLMIDTATGVITDKPFKGMAMVYTMVLSPDKKKAYGNMDDVVAFDLEKGTILKETANAEGTNFSITISSDGKKIYTAAGGNTVTVYDSATLKPLKVVAMATDGMDMQRIPTN